MSLNKIYYLISSLLAFLAAFIYFSPVVVTTDFIYPLRIDSIYVSLHDKLPDEDALPPERTYDDVIRLYNPASLGLEYTEFNVRTLDNLILRGWYVPAPDTPSNTIIIIHDLNQSKINLLDHIKQFRDRGLNVCAVDMRAHGNSDGIEFTPGLPAILDVKMIIDQLLLTPETNHLIVMGIGLGSAIAMQVAAYDGRCDVVVLQSPSNNLGTYLDRYGHSKWGVMQFLWNPVFKRKVENLLQFSIKELDLSVIARYSKIPTLFISAAQDKISFTTEILAIYDSSSASRKSLFLVKDATRNSIEEVAGESYYNRITDFINKSIPRKPKATRFKKLT
jgi:pimeloyl-ACP methyl ester carboxylesterase